MTKTKSCHTCGQALALQSVDLEGRFRMYAVAAYGFPVLHCPSGHEKKEAYDEFMVNLGEQLAFEDRLFTKRVGLFRRRDVCRECNAELNLRSVASQRIRLPLQHGGAPGYQLEITAPLLECSQCSAFQIPNRDEHHGGVTKALRDAVDTAGIEYHG